MYRSNDFKPYKQNIDFVNIFISITNPCDNILSMFFKIGYIRVKSASIIPNNT